MPPSSISLAPGQQPGLGRRQEAHAGPGPEPGPGPLPQDTAPALPFIGQLLRCVPGQSITVTRRLSLQEDLYLADHHFVHAPGVKPLAACFPVLPMTVSLEVMAETAACLAPGCGLTGFENVSAGRWIALAERDALTLRIEGQVEHFDPPSATWRIGVAIFIDGEAGAAISASLLFGKHYPCTLALALDAVAAATNLSAAHVYAQRHLFHGPRFQCLAGSIALDQGGASAELLVRAPDQLFRSNAQPQLLTDPALLDTVGQVMALWSLQQGRVAFPVGLGKLELYGPTPAPGTRVVLRAALRASGLKMLDADVEISDGLGAVWLRIRGWKSWQFKWDQRLQDFRRLPCRYLLSDRLALPAAIPGPLCQRVDAARVAGFDLALLARHYLDGEEMARFAAKSSTAARQLEWLLGRIAAKDAIRAWHALRQGGGEAEGGGELLHPAAFGLDNDACGQPRVVRWPDAGIPPPCVSIAHCAEQALAVAHADPVGIDIERVAARDDAFLHAFSSAAERALLAPLSGPGPVRDAWLTRLWCAKEALGKRLGTGVNQAPQRFEARALGPAESLHMCHAGSGSTSRVGTVQHGDFIIAFDFGAN